MQAPFSLSDKTSNALHKGSLMDQPAPLQPHNQGNPIDTLPSYYQNYQNLMIKTTVGFHLSHVLALSLINLVKLLLE